MAVLRRRLQKALKRKEHYKRLAAPSIEVLERVEADLARTVATNEGLERDLRSAREAKVIAEREAMEARSRLEEERESRARSEEEVKSLQMRLEKAREECLRAEEKTREECARAEDRGAEKFKASSEFREALEAARENAVEGFKASGDLEELLVERGQQDLLETMEAIYEEGVDLRRELSVGFPLEEMETLKPFFDYKALLDSISPPDSANEGNHGDAPPRDAPAVDPSDPPAT